MGGGDNGCDIGLLGVTSNKSVTFPRRNTQAHAAPSGECNYYVCVCVCVHVCCACVSMCVCDSQEWKYIYMCVCMDMHIQSKASQGWRNSCTCQFYHNHITKV